VLQTVGGVDGATHLRYSDAADLVLERADVVGEVRARARSCFLEKPDFVLQTVDVVRAAARGAGPGLLEKLDFVLQAVDVVDNLLLLELAEFPLDKGLWNGATPARGRPHPRGSRVRSFALQFAEHPSKISSVDSINHTQHFLKNQNDQRVSPHLASSYA
jgi:hypothetical protein